MSRVKRRQAPGLGSVPYLEGFDVIARQHKKILVWNPQERRKVPVTDANGNFQYFAIEHFFRFLKQHMGLTANQSTDLVSTDYWMWLCALAYWQLLLMRDEVKASQPAWYPAGTKPETKGLTPGQVQRSAFSALFSYL